MDTTPEPLAGLVREHRLIEAEVDAAGTALKAAAAAPEDPALVEGALAGVRQLCGLLEREVMLHIEKEERVLFPVLRAEVARLSDFVDDMIAEHDMVKEKRDVLCHTLASLDDDHDVVQQMQARLMERLYGLPDADLAGTLAAMRDTVQQLDWVFQGHFTGEEDGLFLPAEDLLSTETLAGMARRMAALEAGAAAGGQRRG